ncbi:MAG TPA: MFS transporter [Ignavibacteriaceae bacterium]|nr:MFS transporter [Ignavibacteriaceae bacterium]
MSIFKQNINPWKGLRNLPHNMWVLFWATLINRAGTMVLPFLALYMTKQFNYSESQAGFVLAVYGIGAMMTSPVIGKVSDKVGSFKIMKISLLLTGFMFFVYPHISNYYLILVFTFAMAVINEAFRPANLSLISEVVPAVQRRTAFALNRLAINLGMSIGPVVGGLLTLINFSIIFYVDGITSLIAVGFLILAKWEKIEDQEPAHIASGSGEVKHIGALKDKHLVYFLIALIPLVMVFFQHMSTMPLFLVHDLGMTAATYGALTIINTGLIILIEVPLSNYLTSWSFKKSLTVGAILTAVGFGGMAFAHSIPLLIISISFWTFGEMIVFPASAAFVSEIAPAKKRGEYMGFYQMSFSLSFMAGPWLGALVLENYGSFSLWSGAFVFCIISAFMMLGLNEKSRTAHSN